jgi:outer membrane lipoprotein-sorting protein
MMVLSSSITLRVESLPGTPFGDTMNEIRMWLDSQKIQPLDFKTVAGGAGLGFEIRFRNQDEATRFRERFPVP